jgi:hypothetical protein
MKSFLKISSILLVLLTPSTNLFSQQDDQIAELERKLNQLSERINQVRQLTNLFPDNRLTDIILAVEREYQLALNAFNSKQYIIAANHIKIANIYLLRIYKEITLNSKIRTRYLEKVDQKIREAEQIIFQSQNPEAKKLLNRARYFRQRAVQLSGSNRAESAIKNYYLAVFFADNAIRVATGRKENGIENITKQFNDTERLILRVEEHQAYNNTSEVKDITDRAKREYRLARTMYDDQQIREAAQKLQLANRYLYRALDLLDNNTRSFSDRIGIDLELLNQRVNELLIQIDKEPSTDHQKIYNRLAFLLTEARQKYESQEYAAARNQIALANRLLYQLERNLSMDQEPARRQIENQLQTAAIMLEALKREKSNNSNYRQLLELVEKNYLKAREQYQNGNTQTALGYLKFFNHLAIKMNNLQINEKARTNNIVRIEEELQRLRSILDTHHEDMASNELLKLKYQNAEDLYQIALNAFRNKNYSLSWILTKFAANILTDE